MLARLRRVTTRRRRFLRFRRRPRYLSFRRTVRTYARSPTRGLFSVDSTNRRLRCGWKSTASTGKWRRCLRARRRPPRARRGTASSRNTYPRATKLARGRGETDEGGAHGRWDVTNRARRHPADAVGRAFVSGRHPRIARAGLEGSRGRHRRTRGYWWRGCVGRPRREPRTGRGGSVRAVRHGSTHPPNSRQGAPSPPRTATNRGCGRRRPRDAPRIPAPRIAKTPRKTPPDEDPTFGRGPWGLPETFLYSLRLDVDALEEAASRRAEETFRVSPSVRRRATRFRRGRRAIRTPARSTTKTTARSHELLGGAPATDGVDARDVLRLSLGFGFASNARGAVAGGVSSPGFENRVRVFLSSATLVIVPDAALIEHWIGQIARHVRASGGARPLRVLAVGGMCAEASALEATLRARNEASALEAMGDDVVVPGADPPGTHRARDFPPAETLAQEYDVVLSTFDRMSQRSKGGDRDDLLRVHFLRLIVDEGHLLGSVGSETTRAQRVRAIRAERRRIMTGTPAPAVRASDGGGLGGAEGRCRGRWRRRHTTSPPRRAPRRRRVTPLFGSSPCGAVRQFSRAVARRRASPASRTSIRGYRDVATNLSRLLVRASKAGWGYFRR